MRHQRKKHLLTAVGLTVGVLCGLLLLGAYTPPLMRWMTVSDAHKGEAYRATKVRHFREYIPPAPEKLPEEAYPSIEEARVYTIGDSFFWLRYGYHDFPTELQLEMNEPVFHLGHRHAINPVRAMKYSGVDTSRKRVVVLSTIERYIRQTFRGGYDLDPEAQPSDRPDLLPKYNEQARHFREWAFLELEKRLQYLLQNNRLSFYLLSHWSTIAYDYFGVLDEWAGESLREERQVFHAATTKGGKSSFKPITEKGVERMAKNLAAARTELLDTYNTELVLLLIPNKVTLYQSHFDKKYNELIPRLNRSLREKGVPVVDLYEDFQESTESLYYRSDPHWNSAGRDVALDKLIPTLRKTLDEESDEPSSGR